MNSNKKYREVRKEQNRLALLREKEERLDQKREKANYDARKRKLSESKNPDEPKKKLTDREQKQKIKMDEADLGSTKGTFVFSLRRVHIISRIWRYMGKTSGG